MPNYDFSKDAFHIFFSNGDELAYLDRESVSALSTVLSAALNAGEVELPVAVIEDMLEQLDKMDTQFAKVELAKAEPEAQARIERIVDKLEQHYVVFCPDDKQIQLRNWNESEVLETFETWDQAEAFAETL